MGCDDCGAAMVSGPRFRHAYSPRAGESVTMSLTNVLIVGLFLVGLLFFLGVL